MKKIKAVNVLPGCISCGTCAVVCPKVFQIDSVSRVKENIDLQEHKDCIQESADMCPVRVIEVVWEDK